jgi:hypothetical protein
MLHQTLKAAIALAFGALIANPAVAVPLIPPTTVLGAFIGDDDAQQFEFSIASESIVTIETVSYAGGELVGFPGTIVPGGGFDPIISLFDSDGLFITDQDDGSSNFDAVTGEAFDTFFQPVLAAGTYTVVITQYDNFFDGSVGDPLSTGFEVTGDPFFTGIFGCAAGQFCDVAFPSDSRTNRFAINISAEALAVPEPAALALLGFGLVGVGMAYRRRR